MKMHNEEGSTPSITGAPEYAARRELLQRIGLLLGAAALPAEAVFGAAAKGGRFLGTADFRLLTAVTDTLVPQTDTPGAVQAGIPQLIDALLRDWASAATRTQLTGALVRIDAAATLAGTRGFARLSPADRQRLLLAYDSAALQPAPATGEQAQSVDAMLAGPPVKDAAYARLKELVVTLYYSSKIGLTQELTYVHAPGKWQPSVPVTKDTRPAGGGGMF
jgi:gluconate 2-dehydrogenase gamma chain